MKDRRERRPRIWSTYGTARIGTNLRLAGGIVQDSPKHADAIIIPGGADVDPVHYGARAHARTDAGAAMRDVRELAAVRWAVENKLPVLGICRGAQVLAVACGGTLVQHIPDVRSADNHEGRTHGVKIVRGSRLERVGTDTGQVTSLHHQAVKRPGKGMVPVARSDDGIIEAIESADPTQWLVGVQWHPEIDYYYDDDDPSGRWAARLFRAFVVATARRHGLLIPPENVPTQTYACDLCDRSFRSWRARRDHLMAVHYGARKNKNTRRRVGTRLYY
jgi:putative glutamine amidotransferase